MHYTIRHNGRVLGTTSLDLYQLVRGQHSGWLHPGPGAQDLLDAISIKSAYMRTWMNRADTLGDGRRVTHTEFLASRKCEAISAAVAVRVQFVLTMHRDDGSEIPTREIVLQDRFPGDIPGIDDEDLYEGLDDQQLAELDAAVAHDLGIISEWNLEESDASSPSAADDEEFRKLIESRWHEAGESRYQVHLRLANADNLPSQLDWLEEIGE